MPLPASTAFVLVHSPAVGPSSWAPVARRLQRRGHPVAVPDLRPVVAGGAPYWPRVAAAVAGAVEGLAGSDPSEPPILVAHSNAGLFLPAAVDAAPRPVAGCIFVDAGLPAEHGESPVVPERFLRHLQDLADPDGWLPRWTDWWDPAEIEALLPDPELRAEIVADQPRLPLAYYRLSLPVPASWTAVRCA